MSADFQAAVDRQLAELEAAGALARLWRRDHTLWSPEPTEIENRLGWLDLPQSMRPRLAELRELALAARRDGIEQVVLCGMGGSSLGAEVLRVAFAGAPHAPALAVLDSTVPDWVRRVRAGLAPAKTLFLIASKSGSTAEVSALFQYFWGEVAAEVGEVQAGRQFLAITDPGSSLGQLASERRFRALLINPPDVGGRFSVLSLFGLVPAALLGFDLSRLLGQAGAMALGCAPECAGRANPGLLLGAQLAAAAASAQPFLTLLASPRLGAFGLWAEQLIGESLGKRGQGLLPIAHEPFVAPEKLPDDRLFVSMRLTGEPSQALERQLRALRTAGRPLIELELASPEALGGEFFRWQFATAIAGHRLGVHPFDQPDVEETKRQTRRLLAAFRESGRLPAVEAAHDLRAALATSPRPRYVALLGYCDESPAVEEAVAALRRRLVEELRIPTTFGYGPRYLHSTGQFHKGGLAGGLHVQLVGFAEDGPPIPGESFGFPTLARAQADGDLAALAAAGRRTVRLELGSDPAAGVAALLERLS